MITLTQQADHPVHFLSIDHFGDWPNDDGAHVQSGGSCIHVQESAAQILAKLQEA